MEDDDDDFYGGNAVKQEQEAASEGDDNDETMEVSDDEEDDSDDDVQFTLEKPEGAKTEALYVARPAKQQKPQNDRAISDSKPGKSATPTAVKAEPIRAGSTAPPTAVRGPLTYNGKEGTDFPEVHTSKINVNGTPAWVNGKPITEVDIDADLAENSKLWRLPGTDITDFFNYGFDEYTWTQYCVRQQMMDNTIGEQKQADAQMKAFFGGGPGGGGGGGGGGGASGGPMNMPGMPPGIGMPDQQQMEMMVQQGVIPPEFAQMMMSGGMPGMPGMGGQGGGFGSGQNSASPNPQPGQGFQPPQGPSGGQQGHQSPFPGSNMEGYSPQQMAIMQQEQHMQGGGGGGPRGRNRRGKW